MCGFLCSDSVAVMDVPTMNPTPLSAEASAATPIAIATATAAATTLPGPAPSATVTMMTDKLKKIVTYLYTSPYCVEFRRPVRVLHPSLMPTYCKVVKEPMDLGTVMYKLLTGRYSEENIDQFSADLALVFQNSIDFNQRSLDMTNISRHLGDYAQSMWEEYTARPFKDKSMDAQLFQQRRLEQRSMRFIYVRSSVLSLHDKLDFLDIVGACTRGNYGLRNTLNMSIALCQQRLQSTDSISLSELLWPVVQQLGLMTVTPTNTIGAADRNFPKSIEYELSFYFHMTNDPRFSPNAILRVIDNDSISFLEELDCRLGELTCHLAERRTRGYLLSAVWAHPYQFVWAQPNKSPWWPGMLPAGAGTPDSLASINIRRLPPEIIRELNKLRPKCGVSSVEGANTEMEVELAPAEDTSGDLQSLIIPTNYCLVEFFGSSHDFGWVRVESVMSLPLDGSFPPPPQRELGGRTDRCTNARAISEAMDARSALVAATSLGKEDGLVMPTMSELEADFLAPDYQPITEPSRSAQRKRGGRKGVDGDGSENKVKRQKKQKLEGKSNGSLLRGPKGMELSPYELLVTSVRKQRILTDTSNVAIYFRSLDSVGLSASKYSIPAPPVSGVPIPRPLTQDSQEKKDESDSTEPLYVSPRSFTYIDPADLPLVDSGQTGGQDMKVQDKKKRNRSRQSRGNETRSVLPQKPVKASRPLVQRSGRRIAWRQQQLVKFAKLHAEKKLDLPNLIIPSSESGAGAALNESAIHRNWVTTLSAMSYEMNLSCSRLYYGEGVIHSEDVDMNSEIFNMESTSESERVRVLEAELHRLQCAMQKLESKLNKGE